MEAETTSPRFLRLSEVLNLVGVTRFTLYTCMEAGTFPKQISVGGNTVVWEESADTPLMEDCMTFRCPRQVGGPKYQQNSPKADWNSPRAQWSLARAEWSVPRAGWSLLRAQWSFPKAQCMMG